MFGLLKDRPQKTQYIDPATPLADVRLVVVDTELTGLDEKRDCIVSIGAVRMSGGAIDIGDTFYQLVNPEKQLSAGSVVIYEITPSEVASKPPIGTVLADFLEFAGNDLLMGHFISLDLAFLNREMKKIIGHKVPNPALDTYSIYEWLTKRLMNHDCFAATAAGCRLYDIIKCFGIPVSGAHNAIMDAYTTALLFQRFIPLLAEAGISNIGDLLHIGKPLKGGERCLVNSEFNNF
jgi:DNA polymerase-3 subunit epsilon